MCVWEQAACVHGACVEVRGQLCRVSSPLLPFTCVGPTSELGSSGLFSRCLYPLDHLFGPRTNFAISQIPMATLTISSTTCVCSLQWMVGTRKLFSICFPPCHLRMPLCQLCGSLYGNLHFSSVTKGGAERMHCKYNKEQLIMGIRH